MGMSPIQFQLLFEDISYCIQQYFCMKLPPEIRELCEEGRLESWYNVPRDKQELRIYWYFDGKKFFYSKFYEDGAFQTWNYKNRVIRNLCSGIRRTTRNYINHSAFTVLSGGGKI